MTKTVIIIILISLSVLWFSPCNESKEKKNTLVEEQITPVKKSMDKRLSLDLNAMQKNHQLKNMRSHLEAIQSIITLINNDNFDKASEVAYTKLGSTTEMRMMCASFGNKEFEELGLSFHESADEMSEIFKKKDKAQSLEALSNTMNYCVQCHATFRQ